MPSHRCQPIDGSVQIDKTDVPALRARINEIAASRVRYGYTRIHVLLKREGWIVNRKRVYRIYREEGLYAP
jgi:putative transposase